MSFLFKRRLLVLAPFIISQEEKNTAISFHSSLILDPCPQAWNQSTWISSMYSNLQLQGEFWNPEDCPSCFSESQKGKFSLLSLIFSAFPVY